LRPHLLNFNFKFFAQVVEYLVSFRLQLNTLASGRHADGLVNIHLLIFELEALATGKLVNRVHDNAVLHLRLNNGPALFLHFSFNPCDLLLKQSLRLRDLFTDLLA